MKHTLALLLLSSSVGAQTLGTGEFLISDRFSEEQSCSIAENLAIENAIKSKNGVVLESTQIYNCKDTNQSADCNFEKNYEVSARGTVSEIVRKSKSIIGNKCVVNVQLKVEKSKYISINIRGNDVYRAGEYLNYQISVQEPMYLYLISIYNNQAHILFPYEMYENKPIEENFILPTVFRTYLPKGNKYSQEQLIFLFSKYKISLRLDQRMSVEQVQEMIKTIPVESRRVYYRTIAIKEFN
jgi:hypothetical protein